MTPVTAVKGLTLAILGWDKIHPWHPSLEDALRALTAEEAKWHPPGQHCAWEHANHIIAWDEELASRLAGNPPRMELYQTEEAGWPGPAGKGFDADWQATVGRLGDAHDRLVAVASGLTEDELGRVDNGGKTSAAMRLAGCAEHESYHVSQIVLLRKMMGRWV